MGALLAALGLVTALGAATNGCSSSDPAPAPAPAPVIACSATLDEAMFERLDGAVRVYADAAVPELVRADLGAYLGRLWSTPVEVIVGAATADGDAVVLTRADGVTGFTLARADQGAARRLVVTASTPEDLAAGAYALLEELGVRFFHPMQELVPAQDGPRFPRTLDQKRAPLAKVRGLQVHVLHPLEYLGSLHEASPEHLAEAKKLVDWLVKTGQNHLQWPLLGDVDWATFAAHAREIVSYAHARGVTVGSVVQLNAKAALQRNYVLVKDEAKFAEEIRAGLSRLMEVPWDDVELAMGEFLAASPEVLLTWLDTAVEHMETIAPKTNVAVQNHVGDFPELYSTFRGQPNTYFYHVPRYADPRLGQTVHTLFWHDLYRPGGMYQHEDFAFQREFIFQELAAPEKRRVRYFPESAYWIATDVDVPAFLPEFIESRWTDIHRLAADIRDKNLPPLDGHVLFTSGHEWGYWMTDYLAAKMLWEPDAPLERWFAHVGTAYGSCAQPMGDALARFTALERTYLFEKKLIPYVSGEDNAVDLGALLGFVIRDRRVAFPDLVKGTDADRAAFEAGVLTDLDRMAKEIRPLADDVAARCRGSAEPLVPWCDELRDGMRIVGLRLEHTLALYRAVLAHARGDVKAAEQGLAAGEALTERAKEVITTREKGYRFDVERLTGAYDNPTMYRFGYLRQAHTQCLWRRQDEQARRIIVDGSLSTAPTGLPSCLD